MDTDAARLGQIELTGTDVAHCMMTWAALRGERVVCLNDWRRLPEHSFDGAVSTFVLHYGVPDDDLYTIARQIRPGGRFSANLFKTDAPFLERLAVTLARNGMELESQIPLAEPEGVPHSAVVFVKRLLA